MSFFCPIDRNTDFVLPPSVQEWLPEAHLARYVAAVVEIIVLSGIERAYAGHGSDIVRACYQARSATHS